MILNCSPTKDRKLKSLALSAFSIKILLLYCLHIKPMTTWLQDLYSVLPTQGTEKWQRSPQSLFSCNGLEMKTGNKYECLYNLTGST